MTDYCKYVDVFYGSGETNEFPETGIASKWLCIKALCGNTTPHALLPFGKISVGAYSGGYPTGYGNHYPNYCGGVKKMWEKMKIRGFSHLHQSGTGAIAYYYNYAVVSPFYGEIENAFEYRDICDETGRPGYYSVRLDSVKAELTATHDVAYHSYSFEKEKGRLLIDFSNDGLSKEFERFHAYPENAFMKTDGEEKIYFSAVLSGIPLYFCVKVCAENSAVRLFTGSDEIQSTSLCDIDTKKPFGAVIDFSSQTAEVKVAYSTLGFEEAQKAVDSLKSSFEETAASAYDTWNRYLSAVEIKSSSEELMTKFYSNFYHSLVKPSILDGEKVLGVENAVVTDLGTFWDQYKTLLPLIYMLYREEGQKITDAIVNISRSLGRISCSFGLTDKLPCEQQAKMLGVITLCDAYYLGLCDKKTLEECIERELSRDDYKIFFETGYFERYTHILDVTDACLFVADITDDEELRQKLLTIAEKWKNAYGEDGLMSDNSPYYEGDRYTYSFRLQSNIEDRIALAGGKESYTKMLDDFFGFGKESIKQITTTEDPGTKIKEAMCHRFEGFNNECDMETPFSYIFTDRHDRLCEIVTAAVNGTWRLGTNGLPGNNDSGGLSSCFMWLVLGIFPWAGKGKFLLGCPQCDHAKISFSNGKTLEISVSGERGGAVREIYLDSEKLDGYIIEEETLLNAEKLEFIF